MDKHKLNSNTAFPGASVRWFCHGKFGHCEMCFLDISGVHGVCWVVDLVVNHKGLEDVVQNAAVYIKDLNGGFYTCEGFH